MRITLTVIAIIIGVLCLMKACSVATEAESLKASCEKQEGTHAKTNDGSNFCIKNGVLINEHAAPGQA